MGETRILARCKNKEPMKRIYIASLLKFAFSAAFTTTVVAQQIDRTVLPIKESTYPESTVLDARDAKAPPRFEVKAPPKAPNVVIVLLDEDRKSTRLNSSH